MLPLQAVALRSYVDEGGGTPFEAWVLGLDKQAQAKVIIALSRLENGNFSNVDSIGGGVSELKVNWGPGYRIYFGQDGKTIVVLLGGGTKRRQSADIASAKVRWAAYRIRRSARAR